ncbi:hypothetical protein C7B62_05175 [Pleurocapsa sp. CCALA 161]|uniref:tetratricopeptide repeat protein n=1 Tax=Pleurocapsa sp. CCALA 161 TaxID=2107688 RepID=UPI000D04EC79|nr:hypothetical protein [Pleurocapsa sp. CCALA 161]PSB11527.1 hypothetical protein C7B62_05175 [Pleurocapsa sp. CCALA 161]
MSKQNIVRHSTHYLLFILLLFGLPGKLQAQSTEDTSKTEAQSQSVSILSIEGGKKLMMEADRAIEAQQYDLAVEKLQNARQVYNQLSNFYLQLFNSFTGLDNAAAEANRKKALDTSLERDKATYQLALVHRSQNKSELSIPLLIQIITSQTPGIGLGKKAYEQLLEIGFVDTPYTPPKPGTATPPPAEIPPSPNPQPPAEGQAPSSEVAPAAPTP